MSNYITSAKKLYAIFLSLSVIYISICFVQIQQNEIKSQLGRIDVLIQLFYIAESKDLLAVEMKYKDLFQFFPKALYASIRNQRKKPNIDEEITEESIDDDDEVDRTYVLKDVPARMALKKKCNFSISYFSEGEQLIINTYSFSFESLYVKTENIAFLTSDFWCVGTFPRDLSFLIFRDIKGEIAYALPESVVPSFPELKSMFGIEVFFEMNEENRKRLPDVINEFAQINSRYVVYTESELRSSILSYISRKTGKYYTEQEFGQALSEVFDIDLGKTSLAGIPAPVREIIRFGPILLIVIMWGLWRAVRIIPLNLKAENFWLATDTDDRIGLAGALIYGIAPFTLSIFVFVAYSLALGLYITVYGYVVDLPSLLNFEFRRGVFWGFEFVDVIATILAIPLFVFLIASALVSMKLVKISLRSFKRRKF